MFLNEKHSSCIISISQRHFCDIFCSTGTMGKWSMYNAVQRFGSPNLPNPLATFPIQWIWSVFLRLLHHKLQTVSYTRVFLFRWFVAYPVLSPCVTTLIEQSSLIWEISVLWLYYVEADVPCSLFFFLWESRGEAGSFWVACSSVAIRPRRCLYDVLPVINVIFRRFF